MMDNIYDISIWCKKMGRNNISVSFMIKNKHKLVFSVFNTPFFISPLLREVGLCISFLL